VPAAGIPEAESPDGLARVRVIAGEALGVRAVIDTRIPIVYQDWSLRPGAAVEQALEASHHAFVYVFQGRAEVGTGGRLLSDGQLGLLGPGDAVRLAAGSDAPGGARLLLLAGQPLGEPVARYGPFVMNTEAEIAQAISDYRSGRLGEIVRA
jgi:redox-sensitive bicupin YhaK (pirin superfamily)